MSKKTSKQVGLGDLIAVLETFGSEPRRWPETQRRALLRLIEDDAGAAEMFREAEALDNVLALAPELDGSSRATLVDRIVSASGTIDQNAIGSEPDPESSPSRLGDDARVEADVVSLKPRSRQARPTKEWGWAAAAMAASLLIGVMVGQSSVADPAARALLGGEQMAAGDGVFQRFALFDYGDNGLDEDLL